MSLGVSPAGIEPALPRDRRSIGRLHHGSRCTPGNIRDGFTPCGESHALPLSYGRARAPPGGFEPPTLRLPMQPISSPPENRFRPRVARGRRKSLGNRRFRRFPDRNAEPFSRSARNPRRTGPRGADSTARSNGGGIRTRIAIAAKYPNSSPPAYDKESASKADCRIPRVSSQHVSIPTRLNGRRSQPWVFTKRRGNRPFGHPRYSRI